MRLPFPLLICAPLVALACASSNPKYHTVDTPVGQATQYGAPKKTRFTATAEVERGFVRIIVREESECDRLKVKIVRRVTELRDGEQVKHRSDPQNVQVVEGVEGTQKCHERFARSVPVSLKMGDQTYRLGLPNPRGEVTVDLADRMGQDLYASAAPAEGTVLVDGQTVGTVSLAPTQAHGRRVNALLDELRNFVSIPAKDVQPPAIAKAYEAYEQLLELGPLDARLRGLETRFLEVIYDRKDLEASSRLERDVKILGKAKGLLGGGPVAGVPAYARDALLAGSLDTPSLAWAGLLGAASLSRYPTLCGTRKGHFEWSSLDFEGIPGATHVAMSYLRFAYGDGYSAVMDRLCRRFR